ncbi:alpha/beta fold hydrolase [Hymenobacter caeli]|uniref:Pimeloyl-ACP methyl ester carboxylesterase n=1 Tax=Hymenobacter caeli TaxID=2735894 RepID=A0ABX2FQA7_9BACT|nr:alpha/beta hydrolase [Hymenobacter caeli]NRT18632.1 pimeloyl-ACP methyl ester carboxylesterase [Hymenobacter caeli]
MPTTAVSAVLALHYWAGAGHEFDAVRPLLPAGTQLFAPDLPGFGGQRAPAGFDYSVGAYADWVAGFIADNQLTDYVLVGHSLGGKVALALAATRPAGLRRLVLLAPSPPSPEPIADDDRAAALAAYGRPAEAEETFHKITRAPLADAVRQQVVADNLRSDQVAWDAWLLGGSLEDLTALMGEIAVPCHLLAGTADAAIPLAAQRAQTLPLLPPGTPLTEVPGAGHLLPYEAPAAVAAAIRG